MTTGHTRRGEPFPSDLFTVLATLGTTVTVRSDRFDGRARGVPARRDARRSRTSPTTRCSSGSTSPGRGPASTCRPTASRAGRRWRTRSSTPASAAGSTPTGARSPARSPSSSAASPRATSGCRATEQALAGQPWDAATLRDALPVLAGRGRGGDDPDGGRGLHRRLSPRGSRSGFFYKFFLHVAQRGRPGEVAPANLSRPTHGERPLSSGRQAFQADPSGRARSPGRSSSGRPSRRRPARSATRRTSRCRAAAATACSVLSRRPHARFRFDPAGRPRSRRCCASGSPASGAHHGRRRPRQPT